MKNRIIEVSEKLKVYLDNVESKLNCLDKSALFTLAGTYKLNINQNDKPSRMKNKIKIFARNNFALNLKEDPSNFEFRKFDLANDNKTPFLTSFLLNGLYGMDIFQNIFQEYPEFRKLDAESRAAVSEINSDIVDSIHSRLFKIEMNRMNNMENDEFYQLVKNVGKDHLWDNPEMSVQKMKRIIAKDMSENGLTFALSETKTLPKTLEKLLQMENRFKDFSDSLLKSLKFQTKEFSKICVSCSTKNKILQNESKTVVSIRDARSVQEGVDKQFHELAFQCSSCHERQEANVDQTKNIIPGKVLCFAIEDNLEEINKHVVVAEKAYSLKAILGEELSEDIENEDVAYILAKKSSWLKVTRRDMIATNNFTNVKPILLLYEEGITEIMLPPDSSTGRSLPTEDNFQNRHTRVPQIRGRVKEVSPEMTKNLERVFSTAKSSGDYPQEESNTEAYMDNESFSTTLSNLANETLKEIIAQDIEMEMMNIENEQEETIAQNLERQRNENAGKRQRSSKNINLSDDEIRANIIRLKCIRKAGLHKMNQSDETNQLQSNVEDLEPEDGLSNPIFQATLKMEEKLTKMFKSNEACMVCQEIDEKIGPKTKKCQRCAREARDKTKSILKFSKENLMIPDEIPDVLKDLSYAEICSIRLASPLVHIYSRKGLTSIKGHVITFEQEIDDLVATLPRLPKDLPFVILQTKDARKESFKIKIRPDKVFAALKWLKLNNMWYKDIEISEDNLQHYRNSNGEVVGLPTIYQDWEPELDENPLAEKDEVTEDLLNGDFPMPDSMVPTILPSENLSKLVKKAVNPTDDENEGTVIDGERLFALPKRAKLPLSEFSVGYYGKVFFHLLPTGVGDFKMVRNFSLGCKNYISQYL